MEQALFQSRLAAAAMAVLAAAALAGPYPAAGQEGTGGPSEPAAPEHGEGLPGHLARALERSAALQAAFAAWRAEAEAAAASGALPAPQLSFGAFLEPVETRTGAQRSRAGLSQTFPWMGTRRLERRQARARAEVAWYHLESTRRSVVRQVESAWHELAYVERALEITREDLGLLEHYQETTQEAVRSGGPKADALEAQMEWAQRSEGASVLESRRASLLAQFRIWLDLAPGETIGAAGKAEPMSVERTGIHPGNNPELASWQSRIRASELGVDLARKAFWPSITLGVEYLETGSSRLPGDLPEARDPFMLRTSLSLPFWQRGTRRAGLRQARWRREEVEEAAREAGRLLEARLEDIDHRLDDALHRIGLSRDTHQPLAEDALRVRQEAYRNGQGGFQQLIEAQRHLLEIRLSRERTLADHAILAAERAMLAGEMVPEPPQPRQ